MNPIFVFLLGIWVVKWQQRFLQINFDQRYPSFTKARVVENKMYKGSQGYGFVAFSDPLEGIKAMKEMNGRLCGSRPMKVMKSEWQKKDVKNISLAELFLGLLNERSETREERETVAKTIAKAHTSYH